MSSPVSPSNQTLSSARAYFEHIRGQADPFAFLSDIPSTARPEPFFEEEWLDFKGRPQDERDAKKIWSKALSGYANITEGLIIWGIDARVTPPRGIDAASGLRLITDPYAFESKLRDWIRDATNPPVIGVEYQSYPGPSTEGFVVCLVPESNHKPHRAEFADKHYYFRAGDDFLIAEPGLLRTLFYPQIRPFLSVEISLHYHLTPTDLADAYRESPSVDLFNDLVNSRSSLEYSVKLYNNGAATAKDVYVVLQTEDELNYHQGSDWSMRPNPQGKVAFEARRPFHPGEVIDLFRAGFQREYHNRTKERDGWEIIPHFPPKQLRFLLYAENADRQDVAVTFVPEDLDYESASATKKAQPLV
jgi:hypothetical protein